MSDTVALGTLKLKIEDMATRLIVLTHEKEMLIDLCREKDAEIARLKAELAVRRVVMP